jgi:hypothetical protein
MSEKIDLDISRMCEHVSKKGDAETISAWGRILIEWHILKNPPKKSEFEDYEKVVVSGVFNNVGKQQV